MQIRRGDVVLVNLDPVLGSEQGKTRPAVIVQNDIGNEYSATTIIVPITSKLYSKKFPTNVEIGMKGSPLKEKSTAMANQIRTIDKTRIIKNYGRLSVATMNEINDAIVESLSLKSYFISVQ